LAIRTRPAGRKRAAAKVWYRTYKQNRQEDLLLRRLESAGVELDKAAKDGRDRLKGQIGV
jgi:hypothetical protein